MKSAKSYKILVVEDEGLIAHDIAKRLKALGHAVIAQVGTADEAVEKAAEADLVLMDIRLDGRADGVEAATLIRDRYHIPVIFLTANADRATIERAKLAEPFGYIVKPLAPAALSSSIEIAMYKHGVERELEEREARLRIILGSVGDAVVVTDANARVLLMNAAAEQLTGGAQTSAQAIPIERVVSLVDESAGAEASGPVALAILRDAPVPLERTWKLTSASGKEMWIEGVATPVKAEGRMLGAVLTLRDVSARRWEDGHLRQANKLDALARLAFGVSSDFATLLATIRGQSEQLLRQWGDYSPARKMLEEIHQAAAAAEQMNGRLNAFGTRRVAQPEKLSINALLRRAYKLIGSVAGADIDVTIRTDPAAGRVHADPAQIEQAIMSLVLHACATMPLGGRLLIETGCVEASADGRRCSYTLVAITYTGQESDPEKLFEPSSAAEETLALSTVHSIAVEHDGMVSARATASGGCRFELLLPRVAGTGLSPKPAVDGAPRSILLAGGSEIVRVQLQNFFEAKGYRVLEAADGEEASAIADVHEGSIDLLIAEREAAERITAQLRVGHSKLQVIEIIDGPERAVNEISRPFTQQALLERVQAVLNLNVAVRT
jgi:two-component system cell cycle sensor histidine kinase/response regulator CckA